MFLMLKIIKFGGCMYDSVHEESRKRPNKIESKLEHLAPTQ